MLSGYLHASLSTLQADIAVWWYREDERDPICKAEWRTGAGVRQ